MVKLKFGMFFKNFKTAGYKFSIYEYKHIAPREMGVNGRTDGRATGQHNASRHLLLLEYSK